jgi:molybdopterin/thiamine biosynthesis adenylyltransferase
MDHARHMGIFNCSDFFVTLIGCGGIGAATAICLAKMGIRYLSLFDGDKVAEENMATQLHTIASEGSNKVDAVAQLINQFSDECMINRNPVNIGPIGYGLSSQIVISAVDSIQARKDIWAALRKRQVEWYIDARMAAEEFQIYCVDLKNTDYSWYEKMLAEQSDETTPDLPCTQKATIFCSFAIAGEIGHTIKQIATGIQPPARLVHNIPSHFLSTF